MFNTVNILIGPSVDWVTNRWWRFALRTICNLVDGAAASRGNFTLVC